MIPNITRGADMRGVLAYLLGKGRREEHASPHLVAGSPEAMLEAGHRVLSARDAGALGRFLDEPRRVFGRRVLIAARDQVGRAVGSRAAHVWHCSLSLHPAEPDLEDARWRELCERFVGEMGFAGDQARSQCRWVAVRHGRSHGNSDHVHLVVGLVAEDGTKARVHADRTRAQRTCRGLEQALGLRAVVGRARGAGERGIKRGELAGDRRRGFGVGGDGEHPERGGRRTLERVVRACGAAAHDEPSFVGLLRNRGLLVRPRYASGGTSVVVGYSVALRSVIRDQAPVWYGGGRLSRELTLPRLRENWTAVEGAAVAAAWRSVGPDSVTARRARGQWPASTEVQQRCVSELIVLRERLLQIPADDTSTWAHAAREAAGAFAAWSLRAEPTPGPLAEISRVLARSAQLRRHEVRGRRWRSLPATSSASALLLACSPEARFALLIFVQLAGLARAIADMHQAIGERDRARELHELARHQLAELTAELRAGEVRACSSASGPAHAALGVQAGLQRDGSHGPTR